MFAMEDTKIMIKLCDTNFKKPNDVKHLYKSGSQCKEQGESRARNQKQMKHELRELREKVEQITK